MSAAVQRHLFAVPVWERVTKFSRRAVELARDHYSRQSPDSDQVLPPGETLLMLTPDQESVWGVVHNLDPIGNRRWRCTIFRRQGGRRPALSSSRPPR